MAGKHLPEATSTGNLSETIESLRQAGRYIRNFELSESDREAVANLIGLEIRQIERALFMRSGQCARCGRLEVHHG